MTLSVWEIISHADVTRMALCHPAPRFARPISFTCMLRETYLLIYCSYHIILYHLQLHTQTQQQSTHCYTASGH
jgi:hypothetical protein